MPPHHPKKRRKENILKGASQTKLTSCELCQAPRYNTTNRIEHSFALCDKTSQFARPPSIADVNVQTLSMRAVSSAAAHQPKIRWDFHKTHPFLRHKLFNVIKSKYCQNVIVRNLCTLCGKKCLLKKTIKVWLGFS